MLCDIDKDLNLPSIEFNNDWLIEFNNLERRLSCCCLSSNEPSTSKQLKSFLSVVVAHVGSALFQYFFLLWRFPFFFSHCI